MPYLPPHDPLPLTQDHALTPSAMFIIYLISYLILIAILSLYIHHKATQRILKADLAELEALDRHLGYLLQSNADARQILDICDDIKMLKGEYKPWELGSGERFLGIWKEREGSWIMREYGPEAKRRRMVAEFEKGRWINGLWKGRRFDGLGKGRREL
ncbi:MAG: hypothetical protein HETSPECPRED_002411 [Heterodermia speciosa]|uniref:Uncharacterized protein n=1 Tax=Heterodermia speciosa TaxID=116794 RepID=A0A8H3PHH9_9LECA|nr:MAG: hypothetical protein HETSPECPRED_002411 [Heterodermia speciosa]